MLCQPVLELRPAPAAPVELAKAVARELLAQAAQGKQAAMEPQEPVVRAVMEARERPEQVVFQSKETRARKVTMVVRGRQALLG